MKRNIVVGVVAAVFGLLLISFFTFLEMRYSENGSFMRQWAASGRSNLSFDDTMKSMGKWIRIHQFVESPLASVLVGFFVGLLCPKRYWLALVVGVLPIVAVDYPSDVFSILSAITCVFVAWLGAKSAQSLARHFLPQRQTTITI